MHRKYMSRLNPIVILLMLGQLFVSVYQITISIDSYTISSFVIILLIWLSTLLQFVPIHSDISKGKASKSLLKKLVLTNWIRTIMWTLLFTISCFRYIYR